MDERFLTAIAVMAAVTFACRLAGFLIGTYAGEGRRLRRVLDILPACAIGAVIGPAVAASPVQSMSLVLAGAVFLVSSRFLLALGIGTAALLLM